MSQPEHFEMLVLGSGEGGKFLAWHMAKSGRRTAVVERKLIGGSCPNTNCLPSKNKIWSAKVADLVHHAARFGMVTGSTATEHDASAGAQARHGRHAARSLQGQRRRPDHGCGPLHRAEDNRGGFERRRRARADR